MDVKNRILRCEGIYPKGISMPVTIVIHKREILLNDGENAAILRLYNEAMQALSIKLESDKQGPKSLAAPEQPREKQSFWSDWILAHYQAAYQNRYENYISRTTCSQKS